MLSAPMIDSLQDLGLRGMARALRRQLEQPLQHELPFEERLALLIDAEQNERISYRYAQRLRWAKLPQPDASIEGIDSACPRGLDRRLLQRLSRLEWIDQKLNLLITGPTGVGKSYLASALAHQACQQEFSVRCLRLPRLIEELARAEAQRKKSALFRQLAKVQLLMLDDFGLTPLTDGQQRDLLELLDDRYDKASTLVTSQLPIDRWHAYLGDPTLADAILDRLIHNAHRIPLSGDSMRARRAVNPVPNPPRKETPAHTTD